MVICKYFLRGTCRFGENCKNEHSYNENAGSVLKKKQDIDPSIIIKSVSNDMDKAENGNQWPFTCYGPFQGKPCFPGFEDKSFEEIRLGLYEAEKNGTGEQFKQQLPQLINEIRMKMRSLQNPTPEATNLLKELFNSNPTESQTTNVFNNNTANIYTNNPTSQPAVFGNSPVTQNVFASQAPNTTVNNFSFTSPQNNIFGGNTNNPITPVSIFNQNTQPTFSSNNIFCGSSGTSIFANAQQNFATNTNIFQSTPTTNQNFVSSGNIFNNQQSNQLFTQQTSVGGNIFTQNSQLTQANPFKQNPVEPPNPFKQNSAEPVNIFQQPKTEPFPQNTMNVFQQNQNVVSQPSPFSNNSPFTQNSILQNPGTTNNLVAHTKSIFGSTQSTVNLQSETNKRQDDPTVYSKLEDLTEIEIKCYEAIAFEFGKIPVNPPTLQMC